MKRNFTWAISLFIIFIIFMAGVYYNAGWIQHLDDFGYRYLRPGINNETIRIFESITRLGNTTDLVAVGVSVVLLLWFFHKKSDIFLYIFLVVLATVQVTYLWKPLIHRPRPPYQLVPQGGYSFPSGHSAGIMVVYGLAIVLGCLYFTEKWHKLVVSTVMALLIVAVMWSRIYLGVHYLSDVLAGFILGLAHLFFFVGYKRR